MPKIAVIGDTHGHLDRMVELIHAEPDVDFAIQVGDFGVYMKSSDLSAIPEHRRDQLGQFEEYFTTNKSFPVPIYFCKGNHEDFTFLQKYEKQNEILQNLFYVPNGEVLEIQGVTIAFLGGNFSPRWFEKPPPKFPQTQKILGYLRKTEIDKILSYPGKIDVLITHEPSLTPDFGERKFGWPAIQELIEEIKPAYAFSGHIHIYAEGEVGKTKCVALGAANYNGKSAYYFWI